MRRERGAILVVVLGLLAMLFLASAAALLPAWTAARSAEDGRETFLAALAARSAVECSVAVLEDFRSAHDSAARGMALAMESLDEEELRSRVAGFEDVRPPYGRLGLLRSPDRADLFDLSASPFAPVSFSGSAISPRCHALPYFRTLSVAVPALPSPSSVPANGTLLVAGEGEWRSESLGWGVVGMFERAPLPPAASSFARAVVSLRFRVAVRRASGGEGFLLSVFFPRPPVLLERRFTGGDEEFFSLPWPWRKR